MKSAVVVFPGINRDRDIIHALATVTGIEPVTVWHGQDDPMVGAAQVTAWLGARPPQAVRVFPDTGHFLPHKHWPEVLGWLARD